MNKYLVAMQMFIGLTALTYAVIVLGILFLTGVPISQSVVVLLVVSLILLSLALASQLGLIQKPVASWSFVHVDISHEIKEDRI